MQATWVQSAVQEYSTCCRALKPVSPNYWSPHTLEPNSQHYRSPSALEPLLCNREACTPQLESKPSSLQPEKAHIQPWKASTAKYKIKNKILKIKKRCFCLFLLLLSFSFAYFSLSMILMLNCTVLLWQDFPLGKIYGRGRYLQNFLNWGKENVELKCLAVWYLSSLLINLVKTE